MVSHPTSSSNLIYCIEFLQFVVDSYLLCLSNFYISW